jgi:hypothetical protein
MHENKVLGLDFRCLGHLLSFDQNSFLLIDIESSKRTEILDSRNPISSFPLFGEPSPVIAASSDRIFFVLQPNDSESDSFDRRTEHF